MRVLIIGASKGVGLDTNRRAIDVGFDVRALARSAAAMSLVSPRLEKLSGDALDPTDVRAALVGVDAVIMTLGVGLGELARPVHLVFEATRVLLGAMRDQSAKLLVCVTAFGAGISQSSISCFQRVPFHIVFGHAYDDKTWQEELIKGSALDWTIVRPGVLAPGGRVVSCMWWKFSGAVLRAG